jgi:hypothetical protein
MLASKINQPADAVGAVRKRPSRSGPSIQMSVPPSWSQCRSQVAHPFPSTTTCSKRPSSLAATVCQIQLLTDPYRIVRPPTCHQPTFGSSSYPGVPSATVAVADSRRSMFIQSSSTTVSREKDCHEMRTQCRWNSAREHQRQHSLSG